MSANPIHLASLTPREAVIDALYRAAIACDEHDVELFDSAWAGEDVTAEFHDGENEKMVLPNLSMIRTYILHQVGPMDTTHSVSNARVVIDDGGDTAFLTATSLAQHCPPGTGKDPNGPKFLVGGKYSVNLIKDDTGLWKIKKWVLNMVWKQGDPSIMQGSK